MTLNDIFRHGNNENTFIFKTYEGELIGVHDFNEKPLPLDVWRSLCKVYINMAKSNIIEEEPLEFSSQRAVAITTSTFDSETRTLVYKDLPMGEAGGLQYFLSRFLTFENLCN